MKAHTRALMLVTLGEVEYALGHEAYAWDQFNAAEQLLGVIEDNRQQVRVMAQIGFFRWDNADAFSNTLQLHGEIKEDAVQLIHRAYTLAFYCSEDQTLKIESECKKREIALPALE
jgi:hypothetical protein